MKFEVNDIVEIKKEKWSRPETKGVIKQRIIPRPGSRATYNVKVGAHIFSFRENELEKAS